LLAHTAACPVTLVPNIPFDTAILVKVTGTLDSAHLKPGKKFWLNTANSWDSAECSLAAGAPIYGRITAATTAKEPDRSELSMVFDHADCLGHDNKEVHLQLVGVLAAPEEGRHMHEALPTEVAGGVRQIPGAVASIGFNVDERLNPGGPPRTVHPGIVVDLPKLKLEPAGGPECGAKLTSSAHSVQLGPGTILLFVMLKTM
jgi:hypothetical protein